MKRSQKILDELYKHYNMNVSLGILYAQAHLLAKEFKMPYFAEYIKELSDDKITIHKDLILKHLDRIQETKPFAFNFDDLGHIDEFKTPQALAKWILEIEMLVRDRVAVAARVFLDEGDFETYEFWTWYINDGLKDYGQIVAINDFFSLSDELLEVDRAIHKMLKHERKEEEREEKGEKEKEEY